MPRYSLPHCSMLSHVPVVLAMFLRKFVSGDYFGDILISDAVFWILESVVFVGLMTRKP